ncbi:tRNA-splicing endonuclease subunit Sen15 [Xylariomycetidae sp. FL0641]|nr:tRNA-splicing endonuclease subunit Sen15 [Xylariomycetidae sp. FL0641]
MSDAEQQEQYAHQLATTVLENLQYQHDWTELRLITHSPSDGSALPRPLVSGLPPRRLYLHPDDQIEMIKAHKNLDEHVSENPETECVLPTHLAEKWSLKAFAAVFDSMPTETPPTPDRPKHILLATVHDDSTITYYLMHDGIVKPRQN